VVAVLAGPRVRFEERWIEPTLAPDLDAYLERQESRVEDMRPGAAKGIEWLDPDAPAVTALSLVYLHGFSADRHEVEPLVSELGRELGANVYFARLRGHGRGPEAMAEATVEAWMDDVAEAIAIGGRIGERVVIVATSTGGTLGLWVAGRQEAKDRIASLVLISPNLRVLEPAAPIVLWPWGGVIARLVVGPERCFEPKNAEHARHWTECYPTESVLPMLALVEHVRSMSSGSLDVPTLVVYSRGDRVVDAGATERVVGRLSTGTAEMHVVHGSGDPEEHVIAGAIMSPETTGAVRDRILDFLAPLRENGGS
jgi:esterase/lipase